MLKIKEGYHMKHYPHPILAKEGWTFILISFIVMILSLYFANIWISLPFLIYFFIVQFFRDPKREIPNAPNLILCPADGKVICVEECFDIYQQVNSIKVSIFMNVFNVHSNRSPVDGIINKIDYFPGKFVNADFDKASTENERNAIIINLPNGQKLTVVQVAGLIARRILCYVKPGQVVARGERYGFIRFGSRVDIYLPTNSVVKVSLGQKVKATETILATLT
jgi:phosphatidylserine decarboxylase